MSVKFFLLSFVYYVADITHYTMSALFMYDVFMLLCFMQK